MAASYIKQKYNLKYILEFRDLWIYEDIPFRKILSYMKWKIVSWFYKPTEQRGILFADKVVVVTDGDHKTMTRHYKNQANKFETIFNGYDEDRLKNLSSISVSVDPIYIGVFGKFAYYDPILAEEFFRGIKILIKKGYNLIILHIGSTEEDVDKIIKKIEFPLENYECTGSMDYIDGMNLLQKVRICSLVYAHPTGLGTKIFDYIYHNKPIISLSNSNIHLSKLVGDFDNGYVCQRRDQVSKVIEHILRNDIFQLTSSDVGNKFSRNIQNDCYYKIIKSISKQ